MLQITFMCLEVSFEIYVIVTGNSWPHFAKFDSSRTLLAYACDNHDKFTVFENSWIAIQGSDVFWGFNYKSKSSA